MRLSLDNGSTANQISHYQAGKITVNKRDYKQSLIISANKLLSPWTDKTAEQLTLADFDRLLACKPKIIIVGTGANCQFLAAEISNALQQQGIGLEVMDTAAACRTYNVLVSEGREVVAGLLS